MTYKAPRILCQPGHGKSCGSCCGMYNSPQASQHELLLDTLVTRTRAFFDEASIHDEASLRAFRQRWEPAPEQKLLDGLPSCPFLGLLTWRTNPPEQARTGPVGCLVHPLQNEGVDGRDCGVYDRTICEDYLCAAHSLLSDSERSLVLAAIKDSYLYGLVITDVRFVRALLELTATINAASPTPSQLERPAAIEAASAYFELKRGWPYRDVDGILGAVIPLRGLETKRRPTPAETLGSPAAPEDAVLACLGTRKLDSVQELEHARSLVRVKVARFAQATALEASDGV